jgi:hypothetical protein
VLLPDLIDVDASTGSADEVCVDGREDEDEEEEAAEKKKRRELSGGVTIFATGLSESARRPPEHERSWLGRCLIEWERRG